MALYKYSRVNPCDREHCGGTLLTDELGDIYCLLCGTYNYLQQPMPYIPRFEEPRPKAWDVDPVTGKMIDPLEEAFYDYLGEVSYTTVSTLAKEFRCSNSEARMVLDTLLEQDSIEKVAYGPSNRWVCYRRR